jgi:Kef-type K+ transport system membrane component KefB
VLGPLEILGMAILAGFIAGRFIVKIKIPAVAGYVLIGVILGSSVLDIFHESMLDQVGMISDIALGFIAFIIGGELRWQQIKQLGKPVAFIVVLETFFTFILVTTLIQYFFHNLSLALILGAISAATAPAATVMVVRELRADGLFTKTLLAVVALDDALALTIYGFASSSAKVMLSKNTVFSFYKIIANATLEIGGAILLGILAGLLISPAIRRFHRRENILVVTMGTLFVITGLANQLHISALLTNMAFGVFVTNFCPISSRKVFAAIKDIVPTLFIAFFVTAGAHLHFELISAIWPLCIIYITARMLGKISGATLGAVLSQAQSKIKKYIGFGLLSQVGVAIGLALIVSREFMPLGPEGKYIAKITINLILATTLFTEVVGPILTRFALIKAKETNKY